MRDKNNRREIINGFFGNGIWWIVSFTGGFLLRQIISHWASLKSGSNAKDFISILSLVISILTLALLVSAVIVLWRRISSLKSGSDAHDVLALGYEASTISVELAFLSRESITSTISYDMIVTDSHISEFRKSVIWTGSKYNGTVLKNNDGNYELIDSTRDASPYEYTVKYRYPKHQGDAVRFTTVTSVSDAAHIMIPRYSFCPRMDTKTLSISIVAPSEMLKNVRFAVFADRTLTIPLENQSCLQEEHIMNLSRYVFRIENPTALLRYYILWEFV